MKTEYRSVKPTKDFAGKVVSNLGRSLKELQAICQRAQVDPIDANSLLLKWWDSLEPIIANDIDVNLVDKLGALVRLPLPTPSRSPSLELQVYELMTGSNREVWLDQCQFKFEKIESDMKDLKKSVERDWENILLPRRKATAFERLLDSALNLVSHKNNFFKVVLPLLAFISIVYILTNDINLALLSKGIFKVVAIFFFSCVVVGCYDAKRRAVWFGVAGFGLFCCLVGPLLTAEVEDMRTPKQPTFKVPELNLRLR